MGDRKDLNIDMKRLKKLLLNDDIALSDAIERYAELLNTFQQGIDTVEDEKMLYEKIVSESGKELIQKNNEIKQRIIKLNKALILQELGIKFDQKEIQLLLS